MPKKESKESKERSKQAIKSAKAEKKNDKPKEPPKAVDVEVNCPTCGKIIELSISEGRFKTQIGPKQIAGKADNPDFPCPFCLRRLDMPKVG